MLEQCEATCFQASLWFTQLLVPITVRLKYNSESINNLRSTSGDTATGRLSRTHDSVAIPGSGYGLS